MRNRFSRFHGVTGGWKTTLGFLLLSLATVSVFSQSPPSLEDEEAPARAWLARKQKERGQFQKVAEGMYLIRSYTTFLGRSGEPSEASDVWTLSKSANGEFQVDGVVKPAKSNMKGTPTSYQVRLNPQMRPSTYKLFGGPLVSGCVWTASKLFCQETDHSGEVQGAAGASIGNSTRLLSPIFPFLFNGLTPNSKTQFGETTFLTLLSLAYYDNPGSLIAMFPQYASITFIRRATYSLPQGNMEGSEFQLSVQAIPGATSTRPDVPVIPPDTEHKDPYKPLLKFLVASNGILLSASDPNTQKEFIRLEQFKKLAEF